MKKVLARGADHALLVDTRRVFTAPWVRLKCQFGCAGYGKTLTCPPFAPTPEQTRSILDSYNHAILIHRHWKRDYEDVEKFNDIIVDLETTLFFDGYYKAFGIGSGPCTGCKKCDTTVSCKHPPRARPSMEACGIDVFKTAREHSLPIRVVRKQGEERDIYGLVLIE